MAGVNRPIKEINLKNEEFYLELLVLENDTLLQMNTQGKVNGFYGQRLKLLMSFYDKSNMEVAGVLFVDKAKIIYFIQNRIKPTDKQISKLAFLFEVNESFFTQDSIKIKINEQLKIELCQ